MTCRKTRHPQRNRYVAATELHASGSSQNVSRFLWGFARSPQRAYVWAYVHTYGDFGDYDHVTKLDAGPPLRGGAHYSEATGRQQRRTPKTRASDAAHNIGDMGQNHATRAPRSMIAVPYLQERRGSSARYYDTVVVYCTLTKRVRYSQ